MLKKYIYITLFSIGANFISIGAMSDPRMEDSDYPRHDEVLSEFSSWKHRDPQFTMLHAAANIGALEWIKLWHSNVGDSKFLEHLKQKDSFGNSPVDIALREYLEQNFSLGNPSDKVTLLNQRQEAYIFLRDFLEKHTPINHLRTIAAMGNLSYPKHDEVLWKLLLLRKLEPNIPPTMLHAAAAIGAVEWIKQLARDIPYSEFVEYLKPKAFYKTPELVALINKRQEAYIFLRDFIENHNKRGDAAQIRDTVQIDKSLSENSHKSKIVNC